MILFNLFTKLHESGIFNLNECKWIGFYLFHHFYHTQKITYTTWSRSSIHYLCCYFFYNSWYICCKVYTMNWLMQMCYLHVWIELRMMDLRCLFLFTKYVLRSYFSKDFKKILRIKWTLAKCGENVTTIYI